MRQTDQYKRAIANVTEASTRVELAKTREEQVKTRAELAKTRREQVRTRAELTKTRHEQARTRAELAKVREEKNEIQTKQVKATLQRVVHKELDLHDRHQKIAAQPLLVGIPLAEIPNDKSALERLTQRQRDILHHIAKSQTTKQIAGILKISPKTVEYHRSKLMAALKVHDVPGLVRFALRAGLIPLGD